MHCSVRNSIASGLSVKKTANKKVDNKRMEMVPYRLYDNFLEEAKTLHGCRGRQRYSHLSRVALVLAAFPLNSVRISLGGVLCGSICCRWTWLRAAVPPGHSLSGL